LEDFDRIHGHGRLLVDGDNPDQDLELDLEVNDLLDEFDPADEGFDEESDPFELDIFADRGAIAASNALEISSCGMNLGNSKKKNAGHDNAGDSTLISLRQFEHDCTAEQVMFDHTLDDMSLLEDGGENMLSELLRKNSKTPSKSRSRFISDESFFAFRMNPNASFSEAPDKHMMSEAEEYKQAGPSSPVQ